MSCAEELVTIKDKNDECLEQEEKEKEKGLKRISKNKIKDDDTYLNELNLNYLLNKKVYGSYLGDKQDKKSSISTKDKKFYRKRIQQITKDLLYETDPSDTSIEQKDIKEVKCSNEIKEAFNVYLSLCIRYFKTTDYNDIHQEMLGVNTDFENGLEKEKEKETITENELMEINEKHLMRSIVVNQPTLDGFVKKKNVKVEEIIIPHKKNINLKEPSLKTKGVKKNITSNYEGQDENKHKKTEQDKQT